MKYAYSILIMFIISLIAFSGCSKLNEDIPTAAEVEIHGEGNLIPESDNFHGYKVADSQLEKILVDCQQCHGGDYTGGITTQDCNGCHTGIQVHTGPEYKVPDHFTYFYVNDMSFENCYDCHGSDFSGGIASPTCETCHESIAVHEEGTEWFYHASYLPTITWDMDGCKKCHGIDYAGRDERISPSCLTCHTNPGGPEACNTCHGQFGDISKIAPPDGLSNKEDQNLYVGAHETHLYETTITNKVACSECHIVPPNFSDENHIDDGDRAEVIFADSLASLGPNTPGYSQTALTCENIYCHGGFEFLKDSSSFQFVYTEDAITGNSYSPTWNIVDGTQAECGTCHGEIDTNGELVTPLPNGHSGEHELTACSGCHSGVVDNEGNIIDQTKHINGEKNVFGN